MIVNISGYERMHDRLSNAELIFYFEQGKTVDLVYEPENRRLYLAGTNAFKPLLDVFMLHSFDNSNQVMVVWTV